MTSPGYREELDFAKGVARDAGDLIARFYHGGARTWEKSKNNPVTEADIAADTLIREAIARSHPEDGLLTEETEDDLGRVDCARVWIVDPIDGTREFTRQVPEFAVSIALAVDGRPVLGVVHNPVVDVTIAGSMSHGITRNGVPARVSGCAALGRARVVASRSENEDGRLDGHRSRFASLQPTGSIAWKLALVASGEADFNLSLKPKHEWDVCAGDFLVHEAGGAYVDFDGKTARYNKPAPLIDAGMIAGPYPLIEEFIERERASVLFQK